MPEQELNAPEEAKNFSWDNSTESQPNINSKPEPVSKESIGSQAASPESSSEEQQEQNEIAGEVLAGLGMLYDILPHQGDIKDKEPIIKSLNTVLQLRPLGPAVKIALAERIMKDSLHEQKKDEFIDTLSKLKELDLWIHMEGLNRAGDKRLSKIRDNI